MITSCQKFLDSDWNINAIRACLLAGYTMRVGPAANMKAFEPAKFVSSFDSCTKAGDALRKAGVAVGATEPHSPKKLSFVVCSLLARYIKTAGLDGPWTDCALAPSDQRRLFCGDGPPGSSQFKYSWNRALKDCAEGKAPDLLMQEIERRSAPAMAPTSKVTCDEVVAVVTEYDLSPAEELESTISALAARADEERSAAAERSAQLAAEREATRVANEARAALYPETVGALTAAPQYAEIIRGIETAHAGPHMAGAGVIFAGGLVDHLLSYCAVGVDAVDRATLVRFAVQSILSARNAPAAAGDFDAAGAAAANGAQVYADGSTAAARLECSEPASTKLLENVLSMIR